MKKRIIYFITIMLFVTIGMTVVKAETNSAIARADENLSITEDINGSSFLAGKNVKLKSIIKGIGFIAGREINLEGTLDYGFIAGQKITISGTINNDVFIAGEEITINGAINKDLYAVGKKVTINGTINRDIYISAEKIEVGENAIILGKIHYNSNTELSGNTNQLTKLPYEVTKISPKEEAKMQIKSTLYSFIKQAVVMIFLILVCPKLLTKIDTSYKNKKFGFYLENIGYGFVILIGVPMIVLLLLVSNIGTQLGLIILLLYILMITLANVLSGYIIGRLIITKLLKKNNIYLTGISGLAIITLINLIPVVGLFTLALGLGAFKLLTEKQTNMVM